MKSIIYFLSICFVVYFFSSCTEFLDAKPSVKMTIPETGEDLYSVLNNVNTMNYNFTSGLSEIASDNVYLLPSTWLGLPAENYRAAYTWNNEVIVSYWNNGYKKISVANVVIDHIDKVDYKKLSERDELLGIAHFFRAYSYYELAQVFIKPYMTANLEDYGLVLRESSDASEKSVRSTVANTYNQIVADYKNAAQHLPVTKPLYPTRPYKASAFAALARTYLVMGNFNQAKLYADSCLIIQNKIMKYESIQHRAYPFQKFNEEVIFFAQLNGFGILSESTARVDNILYSSYSDEDLRKKLFFAKKADGYFSFVGDYGMNSNSSKFSGLSVPEVILIQAECLTRLGNLDAAKESLERLLVDRYIKNASPVLSDLNQDDLLKLILNERRKELVFRGIRWTDMRRLTTELLENDKWTRDLGDEKFIMSKERLNNFAYKIPELVIDISGIPQND